MECFYEKNSTIDPTRVGCANGSKVWWNCCNCGNEWEMRPNALLRGQGCPKCGRKKANESLKKTHEQFANELFQVNPNITVLGEYKGTFTKIKTKCNKCGHEWESMPCNLLAGCGCPKCATSKREKTVEEYNPENKLEDNEARCNYWHGNMVMPRNHN